MTDTSLHALDKDTITKAYARWAPVYDLVFGAVFERGREAAIEAAERIGQFVGGDRLLNRQACGGEFELVVEPVVQPAGDSAPVRLRGVRVGRRDVPAELDSALRRITRSGCLREWCAWARKGRGGQNDERGYDASTDHLTILQYFSVPRVPAETRCRLRC